MRRNRQPGNVARARPRASTSSASSSTTSSIAPRPIQPCSEAGNEQEKNGEWICQFVGLSGDQDPFVLRHCSFNHLNCYKASDWAILRIKGDTEIPLHFTVCVS